MKRWIVTGIVAWLVAGCGDDDNTQEGPTGSSSGAGGSTTTSTGGGGASSTTSTGGGSEGGGGGAGGDDIPGGGTVLFEERFDDADFTSRGWYDGSSGDISTTEHAAGSASSFECAFAEGAQSCSGGKPARHAISETETVYVGMWLKFQSDWVGSGVAYHPHMFHFTTNLDGEYIGPANSHLTTYTEVVQNGRAMLALQDSMNVDPACILLNNDSFVGCNGDFESYVFGEDRSVAACNGLVGEVDGRDCFDNGGYYYSSRAWRSDPVFPNGSWHRVEVYFEMNGIENGIGVPDGKIRWVQDGVTLISSDQILFRTGEHPNMAFSQFLMLPYIGPGSPIAQSFWVDDLVVATARP